MAGYFINPGLPERSLLSLITTRPALTLAEVAGQGIPEQELTCWASLVAGSGSLQTTSQRLRTLPFRCVAAQESWQYEPPRRNSSRSS